MQQESYIQYLAGYSNDSVNMQDVKIAPADLQDMDDEHVAFRDPVLKDDENVLEVNNNLRAVGVFEDDTNKQYIKQCIDFQEIEQLYSMLLNEEFDDLKRRLKAM